MGSDDSEMENRDRVLAPDDLDIADQPEVAEIDDGRYVVSADGPATEPDEEILENPDWLSDDEQDEETAAASADQGGQPSTGGQPTQGQPDQQQPNQGQPTQQQPSRTQPTQSQPNQTRSDQRQPSTGGQPKRDQSNRGQSKQAQPNRGQQPTRREQSEPSREQQSSAGNHLGRQQQSTGSQPAGRGQQQPAEGRAGSTDHPQSSELAAHDQPPAEPPAAELTNETVSKFLAKELAQGDGDYGFDATLNVEGQVNRGRMTSDDVGETLETLLRWYARQTTEEVDPEAVLGIILAGTDLAVEYPVQSAYATVKRYNLKPEDSIGDLLRAIRKEGSFTVPPSKD